VRNREKDEECRMKGRAQESSTQTSQIFMERGGVKQGEEGKVGAGEGEGGRSITCS
jgi:hypothetical protein